MKEDGIRADCTGVGASLSCCADAGRWEEALNVYSRFKDSERLKLDSHCYLAVLKVLKASGKADAAYAVVADQANASVPLQQETYELLLECAVEAGAVSYTHLTLPTKRIVEISDGAESLRKNVKEDMGDR
eukprot:TRINITY_DN61698_c0_g1_i1.p1 TRINITY_DN61698_c0_g1~~TRINITY_DN61698_c0_g1_i1.p1  ORF type:complete len:131 (+),score=9.48 TRINITY_DN61698_c0_g1_i1:194-586(+)